MSVGNLFTFPRLVLEAQSRGIPIENAHQALEAAILAGIYTVIGITEDGDFIYRKVPREERTPLMI